MLHSGQWYEIFSGARYDEESDSDDDKGSATKSSEVKKKAALNLDGVPLCYTREVGSTMCSNISPKTHQLDLCEGHVEFWRKRTSYGKMPFVISYERYGKVSFLYSSWTNVVTGIQQPKDPESVYVTLTANDGEKRVRWYVHNRRAFVGWRPSLTGFSSLVSS